jgi:hypothetical protein
MIAGFPGEWIESLTADTKFTLLLPAVKRMRSKGHILGLKDLAGALSAGQQLSSEHVLDLIRMAVSERSVGCTSYLC